MKTFFATFFSMLVLFALLHLLVRLTRPKDAKEPTSNPRDPTYWAILPGYTVVIAAIMTEVINNPARATNA